MSTGKKFERDLFCWSRDGMDWDNLSFSNSEMEALEEASQECKDVDGVYVAYAVERMPTITMETMLDILYEDAEQSGCEEWDIDMSYCDPADCGKTEEKINRILIDFLRRNHVEPNNYEIFDPVWHSFDELKEIKK